MRAHNVGFRAGSLTVCLVPITLDPIRAVGDGRIRILVARSRRRHLERIHYDQRILRGRVLPASPFDRQGMARVGQARCREHLRLDLFRGRIQIDHGDQDAVQGYAGDPALCSASADPGDPRPGKSEGRLRARRRRQAGSPGAPGSERGALSEAGGDSGDQRDDWIVLNPAGAEADRRIRFLQARDRHGGHVERIHDDKGTRRRRVLPAGYLDRERVARVG